MYHFGPWLAMVTHRPITNLDHPPFLAAAIPLGGDTLTAVVASQWGSAVKPTVEVIKKGMKAAAFWFSYNHPILTYHILSPWLTWSPSAIQTAYWYEQLVRAKRAVPWLVRGCCRDQGRHMTPAFWSSVAQSLRSWPLWKSSSSGNPCVWVPLPKFHGIYVPVMSPLRIPTGRIHGLIPAREWCQQSPRYQQFHSSLMILGMQTLEMIPRKSEKAPLVDGCEYGALPGFCLWNQDQRVSLLFLSEMQFHLLERSLSHPDGFWVSHLACHKLIKLITRVMTCAICHFERWSILGVRGDSHRFLGTAYSDCVGISAFSDLSQRFSRFRYSQIADEEE